MSSAEFQALSQDELRKRLYQTFKNRGVLDALKTQLRNQLIHELMNPILSGEIHPQSVSNKCSSLLMGASNSLVADHLRRCGYEYSLSVFYPESGLEKSNELTMQDLLQLVRINPKTDLYKALISVSQNDNAKGFLVQILMELIEHNLCKECCNTETQTSPAPPGKESLAEKLQLIDEQFADMHPQRYKSQSLEVKLAEYRKEMEEQLQAEMFQKLQHFKEVEIAKIKMDERAHSQKEISHLRGEFEKAHQAKSEALISRERNAIERLRKQQEIDAKEIYVQRQSLLKDIEIIRSREAELKQRIDAFELTQKLQESKNKTLEDALHHREIAVKNIEETYDQKLKNELLKYQLELKEEYVARTKKITEDEKRNKEKALVLHEETISVNSKKDEFRQAVSHAKELELELDSVKAQMLLLSKQNQLLTEKMKAISDYPLLKEEKLEFEVQNKLLKQQLMEVRNENLQLRDKLTQPSSEYVVLQAELKRVEQARKLEHDESEAHKQLLEKQLQNEADHCVKLKSQLLECENTIRKLNVQVEELKLQLKQTQTALENEVYRNPKPSLVTRSVADLTGDRTVLHDIYIDGDFVKSTNLNHPPHAMKSSTSPDSDLEFVANTKARIKELEREAEYLEEAYRKYQHRAIQSAVSPAKAQPCSPLSNTCTLASRQRLWAAPDDLHSQKFALSYPQSEKHNRRPRNGSQLQGHQTLSPKRAVSSRRLSSTPVSKTKRNVRSKLFAEDAAALFFAAAHQSPSQPLSPILKTDNTLSPESAASVSGSASPAPVEQNLSLQRQQVENQEASDCTKPEKFIYEDLGNHFSANEHQEDIPEQPKSEVSLPSGNIVSRDHVPAIGLTTVISQQNIISDGPSEGQSQHPKEEEEQKWEEEGQQRKREDTLEREREKLNEEMLLETEEKVAKLDNSTPKPEDHDSAAAASPNPLEKYMKMMQQNLVQDPACKNSKEEVEVVLPERNSGSEREDSFSAAHTLPEEPDEDFW